MEGEGTRVAFSVVALSIFLLVAIPYSVTPDPVDRSAGGQDAEGPATRAEGRAAGSERSGNAGPPTGSFAFGIDGRSAPELREDDLPVTHGVLWVGTWNLEHGWQGTERALLRMREAGVVPAIHLYYWGDDLTPECLRAGCWSPIHGAYKDRADWRRLTEEFVHRLNVTMEGERVLVFLENEFNKAEVARHEPLDAALAETAAFLHAAYPAVEVVMPLGNWNHAAWGTWDRFAAECDYVGIQAMRAATRHSVEEYHNVYNDTLAAVRELRVQFHHPIVIQDLALSSYPEPDYLEHQEEALADFFEGMDTLRRAGAEALFYRSLADAPSASTANHFGEAERHWGLKKSRTGPDKPAAAVWFEGIRAVASEEDHDPAPPVPPAPEGNASLPGPFVTPDDPGAEEKDDAPRDAPLAAAPLLLLILVVWLARGRKA